LAQRVAGFTGLTPSFVASHHLRISSADFVMNLLADKKERTGLIDGRAHAPISETSKHKPPYDDPSTSIHTVRYDLTEAFEQYFRTDLGYKPAAPYLRLSIPANSAWDWQAPADGATPLQTLPHDGKTRVLMTVGYFDLTIPYTIPVHALQDASLPAGSLTTKIYPSGHAVHADPTVQKAALDDVRHFIRGF
jgi:carboxypeptidase C (cathepsin A)